MEKIVISRPLNGICLNGEREYAEDDNGEIIYFDNEDLAKEFLAKYGYTEFEFFEFEKVEV